MYLEEAHIQNLKRIYESENESLHRTQFVNEFGNRLSDSREIIAELEAMDLIETETDENIFFLTTTGYEYLENLEEEPSQTDEEPKKAEEDYFNDFVHRVGEKKFKKYILIWLFSFGLFVAAYKYFFPASFQNNKPSIDFILSDETIENLKVKTQHIVDSVQNSQ